MALIIGLITFFVIILFVLFYFLNRRLEDMGSKMRIVFSNIDIIHKNQEELLAQNLRMFHENKQKDKERR